MDAALFKLGDFGLCRDARLHEGCSTLCGTLDYVAPEVLNAKLNDCEYGQQADVWSYGVSSYIVWTGESPYTNDCLIRQVSKGSISWSSSLLGKHREYLNIVLNPSPMHRMSSFDLLKRTQSATEMYSAGA